MTTAEKLAKLRSQVDLAQQMVQATDPRAADAEQKAIVALIQRVTAEVNAARHSEAARSARTLYDAVIKLQAAWARGESSATGRALTRVESLAAEIADELLQKAKGA